MANNVHPVQEQSGLGLYCLHNFDVWNFRTFTDCHFEILFCIVTRCHERAMFHSEFEKYIWINDYTLILRV